MRSAGPRHGQLTTLRPATGTCRSAGSNTAVLPRRFRSSPLTRLRCGSACHRTAVPRAPGAVVMAATMTSRTIPGYPQIVFIHGGAASASSEAGNNYFPVLLDSSSRDGLTCVWGHRPARPAGTQSHAVWHSRAVAWRSPHPGYRSPRARLPFRGGALLRSHAGQWPRAGAVRLAGSTCAPQTAR
jgi:hypothetical protein